jgi:RimJ/RimL family protein N-acetyltransferase
VELHADRVVLRPIRPAELDRVYAERERSTTAVGPADREVMRQRIEHSGAWFDGRLDLAVEADGRLVGVVDARAPLQFAPPGVCELGIELFEGERGRGFGTEAVRLAADWLLAHGYPRVQASTDVRNAAMRRVFEKLGWELEGVLRAFMPDGEGRADYALYATTR